MLREVSLVTSSGWVGPASVAFEGKRGLRSILNFGNFHDFGALNRIANF